MIRIYIILMLLYLFLHLDLDLLNMSKINIKNTVIPNSFNVIVDSSICDTVNVDVKFGIFLIIY